MLKTTILLDGQPYKARPDTLMPRVLEGTGLSPEDFILKDRFFGRWTFELRAGKEKLYKTKANLIGKNILALSREGKIIYAKW